MKKNEERQPEIDPRQVALGKEQAKEDQLDKDEAFHNGRISQTGPLLSAAEGKLKEAEKSVEVFLAEKRIADRDGTDSRIIEKKLFAAQEEITALEKSIGKFQGIITDNNDEIISIRNRKNNITPRIPRMRVLSTVQDRINQNTRTQFEFKKEIAPVLAAAGINADFLFPTQFLVLNTTIADVLETVNPETQTLKFEPLKI